MAETTVLSPDEEGIHRAAELLKAGELVAFPTETVYGLGADARSGEAVAKIFESKGRPSFNPLIVHVSDLLHAEELAGLEGPLRRLAEVFWPGPLTLVAQMRKGTGISELVTAGLTTIGVRVPANGMARELLQAFGGPIAAPSANPSGKISPTEASHVLAGLSHRIAAVLDGGSCAVGLESTIVGLASGRPVLLRAGGVPLEALEDVLGMPLARPTGTSVTAPGQLSSHYAPRSALRLEAKAPQDHELWLGFGPDPHGGANLSPSGDLREAAANLFRLLHQLDEEANGRTIAVAMIPRAGLGLAINDRLRRAAFDGDCDGPPQIRPS